MKRRKKTRYPRLLVTMISGAICIAIRTAMGAQIALKNWRRPPKKMGYGYIGIADHTKFLKIEHGLDEAALEKRNHHIDALNEKLRGSGKTFRILKGCEANIMPDGSIDICDAALAKLDYAIAGIHSHMKMERRP